MTEETKVLSKSDQLKAINAQKKELADQQKVLRDELNESKTERTDARKVQAAARKAVQGQKAELRDITAKVYESFSKSDSEALGKLADEVVEVATELAGTIREFAEAAAVLEGL